MHRSSIHNLQDYPWFQASTRGLGTYPLQIRGDYCISGKRSFIYFLHTALWIIVFPVNCIWDTHLTLFSQRPLFFLMRSSLRRDSDKLIYMEVPMVDNSLVDSFPSHLLFMSLMSKCRWIFRNQQSGWWGKIYQWIRDHTMPAPRIGRVILRPCKRWLVGLVFVGTIEVHHPGGLWERSSSG